MKTLLLVCMALAVSSFEDTRFIQFKEVGHYGHIRLIKMILGRHWLTHWKSVYNLDNHWTKWLICSGTLKHKWSQKCRRTMQTMLISRSNVILIYHNWILIPISSNYQSLNNKANWMNLTISMIRRYKLWVQNNNGLINWMINYHNRRHYVNKRQIHMRRAWGMSDYII